MSPSVSTGSSADAGVRMAETGSGIGLSIGRAAHRLLERAARFFYALLGRPLGDLPPGLDPGV